MSPLRLTLLLLLLLLLRLPQVWRAVPWLRWVL
jgi:hypothetical protein